MPLSGAAMPDGAATPRTNVHGPAQPLIRHTMYVDREVARHAKSRSKRKQIRQLKILVALLVFGLIIVATGWAATWAMLKDKRRQSAELDTKLQILQRALGQTESHLQQQKDALAIMAEGRIPGLKRIEYNKLLDVNDKYILNISFSESGIAEAKSFEYHAMLFNSGDQMLLPKAKIFFFDELGVQVGAVKVEREHATSNPAIEELDSGETRSYHSKVEIERNAVPKYYIIYAE